jgi:hypothetical protein
MIVIPTAVDWTKPVYAKQDGRLLSNHFEFYFVVKGITAVAYLHVDRGQFDPTYLASRPPLIFNQPVNLWYGVKTSVDSDFQYLGDGKGLSPTIRYLDAVGEFEFVAEHVGQMLSGDGAFFSGGGEEAIPLSVDDLPEFALEMEPGDWARFKAHDLTFKVG